MSIAPSNVRSISKSKGSGTMECWNKYFGTLENWNNGMMGKKLLFGIKPNIPKFHYSNIPFLILLIPLVSKLSESL
jgi:hypothetical protein